MTKKQITSEWTGIKGKIMAWGLDSPLRRLETLLVGNYISAFLSEISNIVKGDEIILDVGAGSGYFSLEIAKKLTTGKVICLDLSKEMLKRLERKAEKKGLKDRIQILEAEASSFKLENESVDLVVSNFVLHELLNPKVVLLEVFRVLKPDGWVIITDFRKDKLMGNLIGNHGGKTYGALSVNELQNLFTEVGLSNMKINQGRQYIIGLGKK